MRERLINRGTQGDIGEASAIEWLTVHGAIVCVPIGRSPDVDLVALYEGRMVSIQVKTATFSEQKADGLRWSVSLATNGGNQSWNRRSKTFEPAKVEYLFALVGDGRRWLIPSECVEGRGHLSLGGVKYAEFEIERGRPLWDSSTEPRRPP